MVNRPPFFLNPSRAAVDSPRTTDDCPRAAEDSQRHFLKSHWLAVNRARAADHSTLLVIDSTLPFVDSPPLFLEPRRETGSSPATIGEETRAEAKPRRAAGSSERPAEGSTLPPLTLVCAVLHLE